MIRFDRESSWAVVAVTSLLTLAGCADQPPAPRPTKPVAEVVEPVERAATDVAAAPEPAAPGGAVAADGVPAISVLVEKLAAATGEDERVAVIDEIGAVGQNALPAVDGLVAAFADTEPRVRWHAARAIGLIGEDARSTLPRLLALLDDSDPLVVTQAAAAIARIREDDGRPRIPDADAAAYATAVEPLGKTAVHPDPRARRAAVRALRVLSPSLAAMAPIVSKHLADADPTVVLGALHTLADMGDDAVPFLMEAMKDPKSRYWAEVALAEIGDEAAPAAESLAGLVAEGETEERLQAILTLGSIGDKAAAAAPAIVKVLESGDPSLGLASAFALGRLKAAGADEALTKAAASDDSFLAAVAAWALARIHPDDRALVDQALARLRKGIANPDAEAREAAVTGLSSLAEGMAAADRAGLAAELVPLLADQERDVGRAAGAALIRLGADAAPAIRAKLSDPAVRLQLMEVIAALGSSAKAAVPELVTALGDPQARGEAAVAVAAIGADAAEAVPTLGSLLADAQADPGIRYAACYALGRMGPAAIAAEPVIRGLTESKDELMATVAVWAALRIKPDDASLFASAVPRLRRALRNDSELVRLEAAVALGDIGPAAAAAIPILELVAEDDPVKQVRQAAATALPKIRAN
ncbi:MAG: HEAT repeat domain-containing protein [Planctomycetaceae bacterium]